MQEPQTSNAPHGLPLVTHQPLHSASFGAVVWSTPHVWLLTGWPWVAVPLLTFVVVLLVLAGHWAHLSQTTDREQARNTPSDRIGG